MDGNDRGDFGRKGFTGDGGLDFRFTEGTFCKLTGQFFGIFDRWMDITCNI
jgi:hypothetical protein